MKNKHTRNFVFLAMILIVCSAHGSQESGWKPWESHDFHGDHQNDVYQLRAEQGRNFSEQGLMQSEDNVAKELRAIEIEEIKKQEQRDLIKILALQTKKAQEDKEIAEKNRLVIAAQEMKKQAQLQLEKEYSREIIENGSMRSEESFERKRLQKEAEEVKKQKQRDKAKNLALQKEIARANKKSAELEEKIILEKAMNKAELENITFVVKRRNALLNDPWADERELDRAMIGTSLQKMFIPQEDIQMIVDGYEAAFDLDVELRSRTLPSGIFYTDNNFWSAFFYGCHDIINSNAVEVLHHISNNLLQENIKELLDDKNYNITTNFYKTILHYPTQVIDEVRERLSKICVNEKQIMQNLIKDKVLISQVTKENFNKFSKMLKFIDDGKKV